MAKYEIKDGVASSQKERRRLGKDGTRTVLCYRIETLKPIAQMKEAELKELLKSIYLKKRNYLCKMLVNEFGAYNV